MEIDWKRAWYFISQILSTLGFAFVGLFVAQTFALLVAKGIFHFDPEQMGDIVSNPSHDFGQVMFARTFQMITSLGFFAMPVFFYCRFYHYPTLSTLRINKRFTLVQFIGVVVFAVGALFAMFLLSDINSRIPMPDSLRLKAQAMAEVQERAITAMMYMPSVVHLFANILVVGLVAAFGEELMFRGLLQPLFKNWTKSIHLGILITAALFSAIHFDLNGFLPRMAIGMAFGYLFYWTGNLWITILAHFINNSIEVLIYYFKDSISWCNYFIEVKYMPISWGLLGFVVVGFILFLFKRKAKLA